MWILIILLLCPPTNLEAANPYRLGELDYFSHQTQEKQEEHQSLDWSETTMPPAVLTLLESPTPQNAKAYLAWQKQKVQRIVQAQAAIDQVIREQKQ